MRLLPYLSVCMSSSSEGCGDGLLRTLYVPQDGNTEIYDATQFTTPHSGSLELSRYGELAFP